MFSAHKMTKLFPLIILVNLFSISSINALKNCGINETWSEYLNATLSARQNLLNENCPTEQEILQKIDENQKKFDDALFELLKKDCFECVTVGNPNEMVLADNQKRTKLWLFAILSIGLIALTCFIPLLLRGFIKRRFYKKILMFFISFAIGNLSGTSLLHLFPEALELNQELTKKYTWKSVAFMSGVYMFYLMERVLKLVMNYKKEKNIQDKNQKAFLSSPSFSKYLPANTSENLSNSLKPRVETNGYGNHDYHTTITWVIILSDCVHKFIDGVAIGATFTQSISEGISLSVAILFEEIPHQFGDFAILINAKMSYKKALLYRLFGSFQSLIGLIVGILLGENLNLSSWICALAGGMFIYIALVDMIPELSELSQEIEKEFHDGDQNSINFRLRVKLFFLQNIGILAGFCLTLALAFLN